MNTLNDTENGLCEYRLLENGIHLFTLHQNSREAVDQLIRQFEQAVRETPPNQWMPYIVDVHHVHNLPIGYTLAQAQAVSKRYPNRARTRGAHIHNDFPLAKVAETMLSMVIWRTKDQAKFFHVNDYQKALEWVLNV